MFFFFLVSSFIYYYRNFLLLSFPIHVLAVAACDAAIESFLAPQRRGKPAGAGCVVQ